MVTGSTGFVGTNFVKNSGDFIIKEADLILNKVDKIDFSCCDCVLHLAALVHQMKGAPIDKYFAINRDLAYEVAICSKAQKVKHFVLMSTIKVYGESTTGNKPWDEDTSCNPVDPYGESKFEAEKLIQSLENKDFIVSIIRSPLIYGPGVGANMLSLIKLIDKYSVLPLGGIKNKRSMVYIGNLIALIKKIINKRGSGIFIAGDLSSLSTTSLAELIAASLNKKIFLMKIPDIIVFGIMHIMPLTANKIWGSLEIDNSKTKKKLDFQPPYATEIGIQAMIEWYINDQPMIKQ
jgi:UDP-glucose 4-epimerase